MKAYQAALLMIFSIYFMSVVAQAAPVLDCPVMCDSGENCLCTVKGCSDGIISLQNKEGQPINMTDLLLSGDFPTQFFSTDRYGASIKASQEGIVGVKLVCFDSENLGRVEKIIIISSDPVTSPEIPATEEAESKIMAQMAIQDLEAAINSATEGKLMEAQDLLNQAKSALAKGDYESAQEYANEGYGLITPSRNVTESGDNSLEGSLIMAITSIDPLIFGIAAAAVIIAILALIYFRKKKRTQQYSSGVGLKDLVKE